MKGALAGGILFLAAAASAHDPISTNLTWSKEISRVVLRRCGSCHRPQGAAFSLLTYEDARPWAKGIRDEVLSRRMPPWDAVKGVGDFRDDLSLGLPEIDLIVNWVEGGAPEGDPAYLPPAPRFPAPAPTAVASSGSTLSGATHLQARLIIRGLRPTGPTEVAALLPGGEVRRLLWVRQFRSEWNRTYWLRTPEKLPAGTSLIVTGAPVQLF